MTASPRMRQFPRARAIAELPVEALLARADELARRWAVALILTRPTAQIGAIPLEDLALGAPVLCAQLVRAVHADAELERLTGSTARGARGDAPGDAAQHLAAICGARDASTLVRATAALHGVLWDALREALGEPSAGQLGDCAERLALVCSELLAVALDGVALADTPAAATLADTPAAAVAAPAASAASHAAASSGRAVIIDERVGAWAEPPPRSSMSAGGEIEIRDQRRGEEGPAAWVSSIGAQLERFERDGQPFAVLLIEPRELEQLRREAGEEELRHIGERMEHALLAELGAWPGSLTRERPGRCWLVAPDIDGPGAERLAQRLLATGASATDHRGRPLALAIGTAVCPEDGRQAAALAAHADVGLYAARAAARLQATRPAASLDEPV